MPNTHCVSWKRLFAVLFFVPLAAQLALARFGSSDPWFESTPALFAFVVSVASGCALFSVALVQRGWATGVAELAWTGLFFLGSSSMVLVHGLLVPGVLAGGSPTYEFSMMLAGPVGLLAASPMLGSRRGVLARAWRTWTVLSVICIVAFMVTLIVARDVLPTFEARSAIGILVIAATSCGVMLLARRQMDLARIADSKGPLVIAAGYSLVVGSFGLLFFDQPWSSAFWIAHAMDTVGAVAGVIGALALLRPSTAMNAVLAPVLAFEPIAALEVAMTPEVREYITALDSKDPLTRDHVVRTAELALEVGDYMRLAPESRRVVALTGALHDIGKIAIPDEVLSKPGALTDDEWKTMRSHAALGGDMLAASAALSDLGPAVRAHHERVDGTGYPDGLSGDEIPLEARIVAVCDSFDAMAYTRRYRSARPLSEVIATLREHAGTQWDPMIVQAVISVVSRRQNWEPQLLSDERQSSCDCLPQSMAEAVREAEALVPAASTFSAQALDL